MSKDIKEHLVQQKTNRNLFVNKKVSIVGAAFAEGQGLSGVEEACDQLRKIGLHDVIKTVGWEVEDAGNVVNSKEEYSTNHITTNNINHINNVKEDYIYTVKNAESIGKYSEKLFHKITQELKKKNLVLNIGGDHSIAFASILSSLQIYKDLRVIWIDAHGDINTPQTSPSQNYHGMPLAHVLGLFTKKIPGFEWAQSMHLLKPENVVILGLRDIDEYEKLIIKKSKINYYTMFDIEQHGIYKIIQDGLNIIDKDGKYPIHISFDVDSVDPLYAPGTGTIAKGGLTYREIHFLFKYLADTKRVVSMDLVEFNSKLDVKEPNVHGDSLPISIEATKTGKLCLELIARLLGNTIV